MLDVACHTSRRRPHSVLQEFRPICHGCLQYQVLDCGIVQDSAEVNRNKGKRPIKPGPPCEIPNILKKDRAGFSVSDVVRNSFTHSCVVLRGCFCHWSVRVQIHNYAFVRTNNKRAPCFSKGEESRSNGIVYNICSFMYVSCFDSVYVLTCQINDPWYNRRPDVINKSSVGRGFDGVMDVLLPYSARKWSLAAMPWRSTKPWQSVSRWRSNIPPLMRVDVEFGTSGWVKFPAWKHLVGWYYGR